MPLGCHIGRALPSLTVSGVLALIVTNQVFRRQRVLVAGQTCAHLCIRRRGGQFLRRKIELSSASLGRFDDFFTI